MKIEKWLYSEQFKRELIKKIERGEIRVEEARRKYEIGGKMTISKWRQKYGKLGLRIRESPEMAKKHLSKTPDSRIQELESELFLYKKLIEISDYFRDPLVKKKIVERLSAYLGKSVEELQQSDIPLLKSVLSSESVVKGITSIPKEQRKEQSKKNGLLAKSKRSKK